MNLFFSSLGLTVWLWIDHIISWTSIHITQGSYKFIIRPPPCQSRTDPTLNKAYALLWHFSITLLIYFSSLRVLLPPHPNFFWRGFLSLLSLHLHSLPIFLPYFFPFKIGCILKCLKFYPAFICIYSITITSWQIDGETVEIVTDYFWGLQNHCRWWLQPWN